MWPSTTLPAHRSRVKSVTKFCAMIFSFMVKRGILQKMTKKSTSVRHKGGALKIIFMALGYKRKSAPCRTFRLSTHVFPFVRCSSAQCARPGERKHVECFVPQRLPEPIAEHAAFSSDKGSSAAKAPALL